MTLVYILISIFFFGIVVLVHEFGHFMAAKLSGVKVEVFAIGWGKGIIKKKIGDTTYQIGWIPFGGVCKMAGDDLSSDLKGEPYEFYSQKPKNKIFISVAGVAMNFIFAILLFFIVSLMPQTVEVTPPKIYISQDLYTLPAYKAGLRSGDIILSINDKKVDSYEEIAYIIANSFGDNLKIKYFRDGKINIITIKPEIEKSTGRSYIGIYPFIEPVIDRVLSGSVLEYYKIEKGDRIVAVGETTITNEVQLQQVLKKHIDKEVTIKIKKTSGDIIPIKLFITENFDLKVKFHTNIKKIPGMNVSKAFVNSFKEIKNTTNLFFKSFKILFSGKVNVRQSVGGPIKIIYFSSEIARTGIRNFLEFFGLLSIILVYMNLLPIPAVDGSYIVFFTIEWIKGKPLNKKLIMTIQSIGMYVLIFLMILVFINDIFTI